MAPTATARRRHAAAYDDDDLATPVAARPGGGAEAPAAPLKIAVIGSGLSGLVAAHLLAPSRAEGVEVHLFERAAKLGMDANSISVDGGKAGKSVRVDVPMRSFNAGYYPQVLRLYRKLNIPIRQSDFTYSWATLGSGDEGAGDRAGSSRAPAPDYIYNGKSGVRGFGVPSSLALQLPPAKALLSPDAAAHVIGTTLPQHLSAMRSYLGSILAFTLSYLYLVALALWHHHMGHTRDPRHPIAKRKLAEWCEEKGLSHAFVERTLVTLFSAVMTAQATSVREAPVAEVLDYCAQTFLRSHYTVATGVHEVEGALSRDLPDSSIHVSAPVQGIHPSSTFAGAACLVVGTPDGQTRLHDGFHHIIFATQANQTARFLEGYMDALRAAERQRGLKGAGVQCEKLARIRDKLDSFTYEESVVVNHTDRSVLPPAESDWRDLNLVSPNAGLGSSSRASQLQHRSRHGANGSAASETQTMATHILARQTTSRATPAAASSRSLLLQTTNPLPGLRPAQEHVLSVSRFERVILTRESKHATTGLFDWREGAARSAAPASVEDARRHGPLHRLGTALAQRLWRRVVPSSRWHLELGTLQGCADERFPQMWMCGSWSPGIPLLEGCVASARLVVEEILDREGRPAIPA